MFAGCLLALIHGRDGLIQLGQRDLLLSALVLGAYACLFANLRRAADGPHLAISAAMGGLVASAATVKPHALLLLPLLLVPLLRAVGRRGWSTRRHIAAVLGGVALPLAAVIVALWRWHAVGAFADVLEHLLPLHAGIFRVPLWRLAPGTVSSVLLPVFLLWLPVGIARGGWRDAERGALLGGLLFGVVSFCLQGRGYPYQRYPFEVFLLLLAGLDFEWALGAGRRRLLLCAVAGVGFAVLVVAPRSLMETRGFRWQEDEFDAMLGTDLRGISRGGGPLGVELQGEVQCLDMAGGCLATLYKQALVQSTGYLYDCYALIPNLPARLKADQEAYRRGFAAALGKARPRYLIVTSDECGIVPPDFQYWKLTYWPELAAMVARDYVVIADRKPARTEDWQGHEVLPYGYRIYRRVDAGSE